MNIKKLKYALLILFLSFAAAIAAPKVEKKFDESQTPDLIYRVALGQAEDVQILLKRSADPNARNAARIPMLVIAATRKDNEAPKIVKYLLQAGANVNILGPQNNVPVLEAVKSGRADVLQLLIDYKAVLSGVLDVGGQNLMQLAEQRGDYEIIKILNAGMAAEKDRITALKSPESFIKMVQLYARLNCANEYLNYYLSTSADKVDPVKFNKIITDNNDEIEADGRRIKYIFKMGDKELGAIKYQARQGIIDNLHNLGNTQSQQLNGVGTDKDLDARCDTVAKRWSLDSLDKSQYNLNTDSPQ